MLQWWQGRSGEPVSCAVCRLTGHTLAWNLSPAPKLWDPLITRLAPLAVTFVRVSTDTRAVQ